MTIKNAKFVCACPKHLVDVHDGTKNECCDSAVILPLLSDDERAKLNPAGQEQYEADLLKLAELVESGSVSLDEHEELASWYVECGFPLVEAQYTEAQMAKEAVPDTDAVEAESGEEVAGTLEQQAGYGLEDAYMAGFEAAFSLGFSKGFDTGLKLSVTKHI